VLTLHWCGLCRRLKEATGRLVVAWVLASACLTGHLAHLWKGAPAWLHLLGRPSVHAVMSALALIGELCVTMHVLLPTLVSTMLKCVLLCLCYAW